MAILKQISRNRSVMIFVTLGLALYYLLVVRPLSQKVEALDRPLDTVWQELVDFSVENSGVRELDLNQIRKSQADLRASLVTTEQTGQTMAARVELEPEIRAKMKEPFLLIDFQNERQKRLEELNALARTNGVTLGAAPLSWFPEYKPEIENPGKLWAQLSIVHHILVTAINSKVGSIKSVGLLPMRSHPTTGTEVFWDEFPVQIEVEGPMNAVSDLLFALPLRAGEMKAAGLPESSPGKPTLFLDRLLLRKQTPEKLDQVNLQIVVSGFVASPERGAMR